MIMAILIIILGAPGAGKGTQAVRLAAVREVPHISTGELLRENLQEATPIGLRAKEYMEVGGLVPDDLVLDMLSERVAAADCRAGYVLDGFPRTVAQAEALDARLDESTDLHVVKLDVAEETIIKRLAGRREAGHRKDDAPEVVKERLRVYHEQTEPVVRYYEQRGVLKSVDGQQDPDTVFSQLQGLVSNGN
jgi:adenylate kinase